MSRPIHIHPVSSRRRGPTGYRVWVTPRPPAPVSGERAWMKELAPAPPILKLFHERRMSRAEFEAYYRTRLNADAARDHIRALACLSRQTPLVLLCECPAASDCYLPILVRRIQDCRDRGDFRLSLAGRLEGRKCR